MLSALPPELGSYVVESGESLAVGLHTGGTLIATHIKSNIATKICCVVWRQYAYPTAACLSIFLLGVAARQICCGSQELVALFGVCGWNAEHMVFMPM